MTKIKVWISAARLRTLPLSIAGIVTAGAVAMGGGFFSVSIFGLAILTTLGFQVLSNFANDYGDGVKGTDNHERVGPARAMQSGLLTGKELKNGIIITSAITLLAACVLIYLAFGSQNIEYTLLFFILGIAAIVAAITYTVGKTAYGYRGFGDVFVFVFFGLLGVLGCYFLFAKKLDNYIILPALVIGLLSTAVLNLNNMRDRLSDANVNKNTMAVLLGESNVKRYHFFLILFSFLCALSYFFVTKTSLWSFLPMLAFVPLLLHLKTVYQNTSPPLLDPELKKVALSTFLFSVLFFAVQLLRNI